MRIVRKFIVILLFPGDFVFAQTKTEILSQKVTSEIFTDSLKKKFSINYPIRRVYECKDKSGEFYLILSESNDSIVNTKDTLHKNIKAINFSRVNNVLVKKWELNDFITGPTKESEAEKSIWFWTKYFILKDLDGDSIIDPIIVYGSMGAYGQDNGRIKIKVYYKGQKSAIRHQNGALDFERNTKVDRSFYELPVKIREEVKKIMEKLTDAELAIFPYGWQHAMSKEKLYFDEKR